jgi:hypothetical protein
MTSFGILTVRDLFLYLIAFGSMLNKSSYLKEREDIISVFLKESTTHNLHVKIDRIKHCPTLKKKKHGGWF